MQLFRFSNMFAFAFAFHLGGCAEAETSFGAPSGIVGKKLPNEAESAGGAFDRAYDGVTGRPAKTLAAAHAGPKPGPAPSDALACLTCHVRDGVAPPFAFGGRVGEGDAGVVDVDVLVVQGEEKLGPVKTDRDGFFWLAGPPAKTGAKAFVRKGPSERPMSGALPEGGGSCDGASCHVVGKQGKVHL